MEYAYSRIVYNGLFTVCWPSIRLFRTSLLLTVSGAGSALMHQLTITIPHLDTDFYALAHTLRDDTEVFKLT